MLFLNLTGGHKMPVRYCECSWNRITLESVNWVRQVVIANAGGYHLTHWESWIEQRGRRDNLLGLSWDIWLLVSLATWTFGFLTFRSIVGLTPWISHALFLNSWIIGLRMSCIAIYSWTSTLQMTNYESSQYL